MRNQLKHLRDKYSPKLKPLFQVIVRLPVRFKIWKMDQLFLVFLNNPVVGRPSLVGSLFVLQSQLWRTIKTMWNEASTEYALRLYEKRNLAHYAKNGRGYLNLETLSEQECVDQFSKLDSRLQLFTDSYPVIIGYKDGDSFLEAGCGKGQNLKFVLSKYPHSPYLGFDIDERCLQVAEVGASESSNCSLKKGSILDFDFLKSIEDKSVDHVCICGVFSALLGSTIHSTQQVHQKIVDEFVRISKKSVIIIDAMSLDETFEVEIEQSTRATVRENIAACFTKHQLTGEVCILSSGVYRAALFKSTVL